MWKVLTLAQFCVGVLASGHRITQVDCVLPLQEYVERFNYVFKEYQVVTADKYILGLHRIATPNMESMKGPPVLLMHGLEGSSADFLLNWPDKSPAFILASQGYDVWLGNNRGNTYSNRHAVFQTNDRLEDYWNFDSEKMGLQDVPSIIDYILYITGK